MQQYDRLSGKVAILTASTDGIGFAIAKRLASEGAAVVLSSRKQENVDKAVNDLRRQGLHVSGIVCNVTSKDDRQRLIQKALKEYGGIDIVISNAGIGPYHGNFLQTPEKAWDKTFGTNVKTTFLTAREAVPYLKQRGGGSILIVSSAGAYVCNPYIGCYCVTKTALIGMSSVLASVCLPFNIRVNCICPGLIDTKFHHALDKDVVLDFKENDIPMKRMGNTEECVGAAAFLVSPDADYITGETVVMSGGFNCRL